MNGEINTLLFCPVCNQRYSKGCAQTVARKGSSVILHITCEFCRTASLSMVAGEKNNEGLVTMGMLTDLSHDEISEVVKDGPITTDEVLEINKLI